MPRSNDEPDPAEKEINLADEAKAWLDRRRDGIECDAGEIECAQFIIEMMLDNT
jgi:hypothetical protein